MKNENKNTKTNIKLDHVSTWSKLIARFNFWPNFKT